MRRVQTEVFDEGELHAELRQRAGAAAGAIVTFTGYVRDFAPGQATRTLFLEHYPGMCERVLDELGDQASRRWGLAAWTLVHRVGALQRDEPIVFVGVACAHRREAFEACQFLIDTLKTRAPFWKRETLTDGQAFWVSQNQADAERSAQWLASTEPESLPALRGTSIES